ncbi:MAG TPA: hypothetical protein VGG03_04400 [Thermoanaerobaculia bacterium]
MDKDFLLLLTGGIIGFVSSLVTALIAHQLEGRRLKEQLTRENELRREERAREDKLREEERAREDQLRREERALQEKRLRDEHRRQSILREADALWRDIERMREMLQHLPPEEQDHFGSRQPLKRKISEWQKRREELLSEERALIDGAPDDSQAGET